MYTRSLLTVSTQLHRSVIYLYECFQSVSTCGHFQFNQHCSALCALPIYTHCRCCSGKPYQGNPTASRCRQLPLEGSCSQQSKVARDATYKVIYCCGTYCHNLHSE